jgi:hypothetical protein
MPGIKTRKKSSRPSKITFAIRLEPQTRARLEKAVHKTKLTFSAYIELALLDKLSKDGV